MNDPMFMGAGVHSEAECYRLHKLLDGMISDLSGEQQCGCGPDPDPASAAAARERIRRGLRQICCKFGEDISFVEATTQQER